MENQVRFVAVFMNDLRFFTPASGAKGVVAVVIVRMITVHDAVAVVAALIVVIVAVLTQGMRGSRDGLAVINSCAAFVAKHGQTLRAVFT